jgi:hypothetical protein
LQDRHHAQAATQTTSSALQARSVKSYCIAVKPLLLLLLC